MNRDEAKHILLLYRHGAADTNDPQITEALALTKSDPELAAWFETHCARQFVIGEKFRRIIVPAGLKEQIISEHAAQQRTILRRPKFAFATALGIVLLIGTVAFFFFSPHKTDDTLAVYQNQMVGMALRGYAMDLMTNDPMQIRAYLAKNHAPENFILPDALKQTALAGCAIEGWQNTKVSMICFRTAKSVAAEGASDLWLFVVDRDSVKGARADVSPKILKINRLMTATWTHGEKIYLLGIQGDEQTIKQYL